MSPPRLALGSMTGTSIDGLDVAAVRLTGRGLGLTAQFVAGLSVPLGPLAAPLRALAEQRPMTAGDISRLNLDFSLLHADALQQLITHIGSPADLVALHGQTVFHAPPASWQLINPAVVAHHLGVPVVSDLRAADLAAGGQGAPITPIADWVFFAHPAEHRAIINLGGFCNITLLPPRSAGSLPAFSGFDACACNHILDAVARTCLGAPYDSGGRAALSAAPDPAATSDLTAILAAQGAARRSLGTGDEAAAWINRHRTRATGPALAASACQAIAATIAARLGAPHQVLLAGGGAANAALTAAIARACAPAQVTPTDTLGLPAPFREAAAIAVLGALSADAVPITAPATTGVAHPPVAGLWCGPRPT